MKHMKEIRVAVVGLGLRGKDNTKCILNIPGVRVTAVCDVYEDRCLEGIKVVTDKGFPAPEYSCDYHEVITREDVDAVLVCDSCNRRYESRKGSRYGGWRSRERGGMLEFGTYLGGNSGSLYVLGKLLLWKK